MGTIRWAAIAACSLLSLAVVTRADGAGLTGDEVQVDLITGATGGFPDPTAVVDAGVEFTRNFPPFATITVDVLDSGFVLTYSGTASISAGGFNAGLQALDFSSLDFASGDVITGVSMDVGSTWPQGDLGAVTFGPHSVSLPILGTLVHANETLVVSFTFTTPEPDGALSAQPAALALAVLAYRRRARATRGRPA